MTSEPDELVELVHDLQDELDELRGFVTCRRCSAEPPLPPRWGGDPRARDERPPHSCGKPPWSA